MLTLDCYKDIQSDVSDILQKLDKIGINDFDRTSVEDSLKMILLNANILYNTCSSYHNVIKMYDSDFQ